MDRSRFETLGGYLEAQPPPKQSQHINIADFIAENRIDDEGSSLLHLRHTSLETTQTLRVAEDTRFIYKHLHVGGHLRLLRTQQPLLVYKPREGQSQSSQTPRKLLFHLCARAVEHMILQRNEMTWSKFCVWGAGRNGKGFIKALQPEFRERIACLVDVDQKRIDAGEYYKRELGLRIPFVHFSLLARDPEMRERLGESYEAGVVGNHARFGRTQKDPPGSSSEAVASASPRDPPRKQRKVSRFKSFDDSILPTLPVVVCVAMYRTGGTLEHNVQSNPIRF